MTGKEDFGSLINELCKKEKNKGMKKEIGLGCAMSAARPVFEVC